MQYGQMAVEYIMTGAVTILASLSTFTPQAPNAVAPPDGQALSMGSPASFQARRPP